MERFTNTSLAGKHQIIVKLNKNISMDISISGLYAYLVTCSLTTIVKNPIHLENTQSSTSMPPFQKMAH